MRPEHLSLILTPGRAAIHPSEQWAVVAVHRPDLEENDYLGGLWRISLPDGAIRPFTFGKHDSQPEFSADGNYLAFLRRDDSGTDQLAVLDLRAGEPQLLTDHRLPVAGRPRFSPDSTRIAYTARVPAEGRYGTVEDIGPRAEAPRHITSLSYRHDGVGFYLDRPQQVFVARVPGAADAADSPVMSHIAATPDAPGTNTDDAAGTPDLGERAEPLSAPADPPTTVRQITTAARDHCDPVWTPDGTGLLIRRSVPDALAGELIHHQDSSDSPPQLFPVQNLAPQHMAFSADGTTLWLLLTDLGPEQDDHIGKSPALYRAAWRPGEGAGAGEGPVQDLERLSDPSTQGLTGVIEPFAEGVLLTRRHRGRIEAVQWREDERKAAEPTAEPTGEQAGEQAGAPTGEQATGRRENQATELTEVLNTDGEVSGACTHGRLALATASSPDSAGDLYLLDGGTTRRLTDFSAALRAQADLTELQEVTATSADGYPVHGWVAVPGGLGPHPVLLLIHGGPHSHYTPALFDEVQTYAAAGYAVVFCNPRGSAGYGQAHGQAITHAMGAKDAEDVLSFLDHALADERLDAGRVGVMGGSYGGYLSAWLTTRTHRFAAAIVERGFLDPVSFVGTSDIGWYFPIAYVGTDPERVAAQSPMAHLDQVRTPTLVIHSEQDWRCPVEQGQRWYTGLRRRGVPAEFLLFPGEGHELSRSGQPRHRVQRFEHILTWWRTHLPVGE